MKTIFSDKSDALDKFSKYQTIITQRYGITFTKHDGGITSFEKGEHIGFIKIEAAGQNVSFAFDGNSGVADTLAEYLDSFINHNGDIT
jgi:hypothetical protein